MEDTIIESLHVVQKLYDATKEKLEIVINLSKKIDSSIVNELKRQYRCLIFDLENTDFDIAATRLSIIRRLERTMGIWTQ